MKITRIELNDFRAFAHPESFDLGDGKNMLLYGANGSGKSSLFRALREIFNHSSSERFSAHKNVFTDPGRTDGYVKVHFSLPNPGTAINVPTEWFLSGARASADQRIVQGALRTGILDYRSLLDTHYVFKDGEINLFDVLVKGILRPWMINVPSRGLIRLGTLWDETTAKRTPTLDEQRRRTARARRLRNQTQRRVRAANDAATVFNTALRSNLGRIVMRGNRILRRLGFKRLSFTLKPDPVSYDSTSRQFAPQTVRIRVSLHGRELPRPHLFLNEARLSALAIALYFAALLEVVPQDPAWPRLLVLDDVLIGLDMDNRIPVLNILRSEFREWQIFLLTHDRTWFEVTQIATASDDNWASFEMHPRPREERGMIIDVPWVHRPSAKLRDLKNVADDFLAKAQAFLASNDERTAAFHARVAFEAKLKGYCHDRQLPVRYMLDGRRLDTDEFLDAIERSLQQDGTYALVHFQIQAIRLFRRSVLNPYAHYHPVTVSPSEVKGAIRAVAALNFHRPNTNFLQGALTALTKPVPSTEDIFDAACWLRTAFEVDLRELLVRLAGSITYRSDWTKVTLIDIWNCGTMAMTTRNAPLAATLIADVQNHRRMFIDEWTFPIVNAFTQAEVLAACNSLKDPAAIKTRLSTFA